MELVNGISAKQWLDSNPPINSRVLVWRLFSRAMKYLYVLGLVHGDPHTGNILVFRDDHGIFSNFHGLHVDSLGVKVADIGTSVFWSSPQEFAARESRLLFESAQRLFHDQPIRSLLELPQNSPHYLILKVLDAFCEYVEITLGPFDGRDAGLVSSRIAQLAVDFPFFRLQKLIVHAATKTPATRDRLIRRRNAFLRDLNNVLDANDEGINEEAETLYVARRRAFAEACSKEFRAPAPSRPF
ncbi:MAG: eukaryotic-like serine/threonine-protein kinase [Methylobacteriaceae bacterium]|nr:eukaryotic-like serine/threonine-protein kinase [Methylobacteriaceae bacterium]